MAEQQPFRGVGVSEDSTPFSAVNATAVAAGATAQSIKAAVAGKRYWITSCFGVNTTTGEDAILQLEDSDDTIYAVIAPADVDQVTAGGAVQYVFNPPIPIPVGVGIQVACIGDVGDSYMTVTGYVEN